MKTLATPARGLEYFFSKQRLAASSSSQEEPRHEYSTSSNATGLTDEELAMKLQAEFDKEAKVIQPRRDLRSKTASVDDKLKYIAPTVQEKLTAATSPMKSTPTLALQSAATTEDTLSSTIPLDEDIFVFEPSVYLPALQNNWSAQGGDASYALLTRCFVLVNGTQSRIKIVDTLVNYLRLLIEGDPSSLLSSVCHSVYDM